MCSTTQNERPHVLCIPYPAQGHITPMLNLAKLLHNKNFHVTFVNSEYNHNRLIKSRGPAAVTGIPFFQFETIPDGLDMGEGGDATQDIPSLCESTKRTCLGPFKKLLCKLNETGPEVSFIVSDGAMTFTLDAADEFGIPNVLFWTTSVCGFMGYVHFRQLIDKGYSPLKDTNQLTNGYLDTIMDWIPSMKGIRLKDFPSFIRTTDPNDIMLNFILSETERAHKASAIIFNTFYELEHEVIDSLSTMYPPIYTVGPLHQVTNNIIQDHDLNPIKSNLWKEEEDCITWLDSKQPNSVLYVNFGSITVMTAQQLIEFAWGLCNSNKTFLWVIRPDLVTGDSAILDTEFLNQTHDRRLLATWCAQEKVLAHPSIGCFVTHNGWNSTLESLSNGVPMICWPFFAEQQTNCFYSCQKWGLGIEISSNVKRDEVKDLVEEVMEKEKGKDMKMKAMEWKKLAEEVTTSPNGSHKNLDHLINQVFISSKKKNSLLN